MKQELERFFAALRFFTRLPVPAWVGHSQDELNHAARYFPLVGVLVGGIGAVCTWAASQFLPWPLAVLLGMMATLLATGAFHEDGLADSADGFGGGWEPAQVLAIMKDSRIGSYGTIAIIMTLLAKWQALVALGPAHIALALLAGHGVSRLVSTALIHHLDYVRDDTGKAKPLAERLQPVELVLATLFALLPCLLLPFWAALLALSLAAATGWLAGRYFRQRIGGYTGDCLGAAQQLSELAFYLGLLACGCS